MLIQFLDGSEKEFTHLQNANLQYANLQYADLRGANLRGADLRDANLRGADLRGADLHVAYLRNADLRYANLRYANLHSANLQYANLQSIIPSNNSHDLISAILFQCAEGNIEKEMIAGLILLRRDLCWKGFLLLSHPQKDWAIQTLKDKGFVISED